MTPREAATLQPGAHRVEVVVVRDDQVPLLEPPGRLLAQDAGRLAARVPLDDAALDLEVAVRERERRRVEPERVVVLGDQRRPACRPVTASSSCRVGSRCGSSRRCASRSREANDPGCTSTPSDPLERLGERRAAVEARPRSARAPSVGKVHVRVGEAGDDDAPAEVDRPRARRAPSRARRRRLRSARRRSPARAASGTCGSSVRMRPFSRITLGKNLRVLDQVTIRVSDRDTIEPASTRLHFTSE